MLKKVDTVLFLMEDAHLLHRVLNKPSHHWRRPLMEYLWVMGLFPLSGLVRAALLLLPFRWLAPCLGVHYQNIELSPLVADRQRIRARRIGRVVAFTCRHTPWQSRCLVQAILASALLNCYRIPYALYLGVGKPPVSDCPPDPGIEGDKLRAHAWVKVGATVITGRGGHRRYTVVSTFLARSLAAKR